MSVQSLLFGLVIFAVCFAAVVPFEKDDGDDCSFLTFGRSIQPNDSDCKEIKRNNEKRVYCCYNFIRTPYCCAPGEGKLNDVLWIVGPVGIIGILTGVLVFFGVCAICGCGKSRMGGIVRLRAV